MAQEIYVRGEWNTLCDICGFRFKASQLTKDYRGLYVCKKDWDNRNPQDFVRSVPENTGVPWTRPEHISDAFAQTGRLACEGSTIGLGTVVTLDTGTYFVDCTNDEDGEKCTIDLTAANLIPSGYIIRIRHIYTGVANGTGTLTISPAGSDFINGSTNIPMNQTRDFVSNGVNSWQVWSV